MTPDSELLERYARLGSQDAFAELVNRHLNLVYSAALRQVNGDAHLAQDVAQTVFADLARKAATLSRRATITGWLYTSAHFAAAKIARTENRRRDREEKFMREPIHETALETDWKQIRPTLDKAMHELKEADREAILLRYFENRQFAEVGEKLGLNENAARMRVERALEKLRTILAQGGISTTAALSTVISANAVQLAPAGLAATLTSTSLALAGTGTTLTLMKIITMTKLKLALSAIVVAGAAATVVIQHQTQTQLRDENRSFHEQIGQLHIENQRLSNLVAQASGVPARTDDQLLELVRLRGDVRLLRAQTNELGTLLAAEQRAGVSGFTNNQKNIVAPMEEKMSVRLNFINTDLNDILQIYARLTDSELELSDRIKQLPAKLTFTITNQLTRSETVALFEQALEEKAGIIAIHTNRITLNLRQDLLPTNQ